MSFHPFTHKHNNLSQRPTSTHPLAREWGQDLLARKQKANLNICYYLKITEPLKIMGPGCICHFCASCLLPGPENILVSAVFHLHLHKGVTPTCQSHTFLVISMECRKEPSLRSQAFGVKILSVSVVMWHWKVRHSVWKVFLPGSWESSYQLRKLILETAHVKEAGHGM